MGISNLELYRQSFSVINSLARGRFVTPTHSVARENAASKNVAPQTIEDTLIIDIYSVLNSTEPGLSTQPYWLTGGNYHPIEAFVTCVEFFDRHVEPLPTTTLPPEQDVAWYIHQVLHSSHKVSIPEQLKLLLAISNNQILGAANIGMLASRIMARGWDTRAYPSIPVDIAQINRWNNQLYQFEVADGHANDAPGDTYYYWTHFLQLPPTQPWDVVIHNFSTNFSVSAHQL
jgi:hypothetical protein